MKRTRSKRELPRLIVPKNMGQFIMRDRRKRREKQRQQEEMRREASGG